MNLDKLVARALDCLPQDDLLRREIHILSQAIWILDDDGSCHSAVRILSTRLESRCLRAINALEVTT